jgi:hypothetical protein
MRLARIVNKYQFVKLEEWATEVLTHHCRAHGRMGKCTFEEMRTMLQIAATCTSEKFTAAVESGILARLEKTEDIPWTDLLTFVERYGRRQFRGMVYYYLLQAVEKSGVKGQASTTVPIPAISLDNNQLQSIKNGFWSLSKLVDWTLAQPLSPQSTNSSGQLCSGSNHQGCQKWWSDEVISPKGGQDFLIPKADALQRLSRVRQRAKQKLSSSSVTSRCIRSGASRIDAAHNNLIQTMADHFFGVLIVPAAGSTAATESS